MRETSYARELVFADIGGCRIERIHVKEADQEEIPFSWWKNGRFQPRPLDLPEKDRLILFGEAVAKDVFSEEFLTGLQTMLNAHFRDTEIA